MTPRKGRSHQSKRWSIKGTTSHDILGICFYAPRATIEIDKPTRTIADAQAYRDLQMGRSSDEYDRRLILQIVCLCRLSISLRFRPQYPKSLSLLCRARHPL